MVISGFGFVVGSFIGGGNIRVRVRGGQFYWWRKLQGSGSWWAVLLVEETSGFGFVVGSFIGGGNFRVRVRGGQFYWWRKLQGSGSWWAVLLVEETGVP